MERPSLNEPSGALWLQLSAYPRYNFYLETEEAGSFLVDTQLSDRGQLGTPYRNSTSGKDGGCEDGEEPFLEMLVTVGVWGPGKNITLVRDAKVPVNATGIEVPFNITLARSVIISGNTSAQFTVQGKSPDGSQIFTSTTSLEILPERSDGGSMARIDRLTGGIHVHSRLTNSTWESLFPVGFYTRWDWISYLIDPANNPIPPNLASNETKSLKEYKARGYNLIHPVPPGGYSSFDTPTLEAFLSICDELELYVMYDMRHTYLNASSIAYQLPRLQHHPSLLLYYTGDEPDGWTDPLNGTVIAYDIIRSIDPYHPVSLVLNCYNFYFKEYTAGADIILEDTYPIVKSSSFSPVYNTLCNRTYGDCGCDFCHAGDPAFPSYVARPFQDVVDRTDNFYTYQNWIGQGATKPVWGVPQWFYDQDSFWERWATGREAVVMALLRINHGGRGVVGWLFPTSVEVERATTEMGRVLGREDVKILLVDGREERVEVSGEAEELDVAAWVGDGEVLIIVVWPERKSGGDACFEIPTGGGSVKSVEVLLGEDWSGNREGNVLCKDEVAPLEFSILKIETGGY